MKVIFFSVILGLVIQAQCGCVGSLYASDPFSYGLYLYDGSACQSEQDYWTYNYNSDLVYSKYINGQMTIAPEGSRTGSAIDLGDQNTIYDTYGCTGANSVYSSIHYGDMGQIVVQQEGYSTFQPLNLWNMSEGQANANFVPVVGHVYIINITDTYSYGFSRVAKMIVLDVTATYITLRWDVLSDTENMEGPCFIQSSSVMNTVIQGNSNNNPYYPNGESSFGFSSSFGSSVYAPIFFSMIGMIGLLTIAFCCLTAFLCIRACGRRRRHYQKHQSQAPQPPQAQYQYYPVPQAMNPSQPLLPPNYNTIQQQPLLNQQK